jgi:hypothetical protein
MIKDDSTLMLPNQHQTVIGKSFLSRVIASSRHIQSALGDTVGRLIASRISVTIQAVGIANTRRTVVSVKAHSVRHGLHACTCTDDQYTDTVSTGTRVIISADAIL